MPWLRALYGLTWAEVEMMSRAELEHHLDALPEIRQRLTQVELVRRG